MTDSEILARWQGWTDVWQGNTTLVGTAPHNAVQEEVPDYPNDAAACDSLLDTLVEKKYPWKLWYHDGYHLEVTHGWNDKTGYTLRTYMIKPSRREAIVAACLEVARKEMEG